MGRVDVVQGARHLTPPDSAAQLHPDSGTPPGCSSARECGPAESRQRATVGRAE